MKRSLIALAILAIGPKAAPRGQTKANATSGTATTPYIAETHRVP